MRTESTTNDAQEFRKRSRCLRWNLTEDWRFVKPVTCIAPQQMTSVQNSTELEITALQSGRSRSALIKDPEPPSVPPTKK
ncbi:hypothetical protein Tco_0803650 [Tanacetum coccineum]|uniref:Uncharacterized protein n=1 Tax=Tanacetum coccineum TaxID=301880 RepID=A0ABQ5A5Y0_9ASTR